MNKEEFDLSWKNKNPSYLCELQKFLDKVDAVPNEELRQEILNQMLKCDDTLTKLCCEMLENEYLTKSDHSHLHKN